MRGPTLGFYVVLAGLALPAVAQNVNTIVVPPAPPLVAAPATTPAAAPSHPAGLAAPPGMVQTPVPPAPVASDNTDTGAAPPVPPAPPANPWLPGTTAVLGVLDEMDGSVSEVRIPVGGQADIGDLRVAVAACLLRPPDQIPDAAAFITAQSEAAQGSTVQNSAAQDSAPLDDTPASATAGPMPAYRGWMVRSVPGAAVVGDASETFRIVDCS